MSMETGLEASWLLLWSSKEIGDLNKDSVQQVSEERKGKFKKRLFSRHQAPEWCWYHQGSTIE